MHSVYPNEVLHFSQRAKGMGLYSLFQAAFGIGLTYGASALIAKIGWKVFSQTSLSHPRFANLGADLFPFHRH